MNCDNVTKLNITSKNIIFVALLMNVIATRVNWTTKSYKCNTKKLLLFLAVLCESTLCKIWDCYLCIISILKDTRNSLRFKDYSYYQQNKINYVVEVLFDDMINLQ